MAGDDDVRESALDIQRVERVWIVEGDVPPGNRLVGMDAGHQLVVSAELEDGAQVDVTRLAQYRAEPSGVVEVSSSGWITPVRDGEVEVTAELGRHRASVKLSVVHTADPPPVNFPNEVVPIFTKYGCNGGGCHGKSGGQNGFRLSLLGFEPREDYEWLWQESRGRRLFPAAPERSLLLLKATGSVPHGGGQRFEVGSPAYRLLHRWIAQGMPYGQPGDPTVVRIEVFPRERTMQPGSQQQLRVLAHFSDGSIEDVTRTAQLESNDAEMGQVGEDGLLQTGERAGTLAVMARYQGHVDVFRAVLPLGVPFDPPPSRNFIDSLVTEQLEKLGLPPSELCDDATFLRRVTVAIAGRIPTAEEAAEFLADTSADKRSRWIDRLLDGTDYADHFATKWAAILRNKRNNEEDKLTTFAFYYWIRQSLHENKPYDQFVREILTASGSPSLHAPVGWYREVDDQAQMVEDSAQLFLGLRIQCARCHHHPFEKWSQQDYYGMAAFFSRLGRQRSPEEQQVIVAHQPGKAEARNPKTGEQVLPTGLDAAPLKFAPEVDPRHHLADWMTSPENPFFARALVNRYWKHFFGRGIVDPEDDMRVTNPATNPKLLDALEEDFIASGFDLKHLCRTICNSATFQRSALPNDYNQQDKQSFSRFYPQRLTAETLLDAVDYVTGVPTQFPGMPLGTRAIQLPDSGFDSYFLAVFGRPEANSACECERSLEANLAQSLHLLNSNDIQQKLASDSGRAAKLAQDTARSDSEKVEELYLSALSRRPTADELKTSLDYIDRAGPDGKRRAFEDLIWALVNTKEFLFNH